MAKFYYELRKNNNSSSKSAGKYLNGVLDRLIVDKDEKKKGGNGKASADEAYVTGDAEDEVEDIVE